MERIEKELEYAEVIMKKFGCQVLMWTDKAMKKQPVKC